MTSGESRSYSVQVEMGSYKWGGCEVESSVSLVTHLRLRLSRKLRLVGLLQLRKESFMFNLGVDQHALIMI